MKRSKLRELFTAAGLAAALLPGAARAADPWADAVVHYDGGAAPDPGYTTPAAALGQPTRFTIDPFGFMDTVVTPSNPAFGYNEIVSIGAGGSLTLRFDEPVTNDPLNPFGIDLIVFGNSFLTGDFFSANPTNVIHGISADGGAVAVSADGVNFFTVPGAADGMFPTNAYADVFTPFTSTVGLLASDFTKPVDPAFSPIGKTFAQVIAGYNGSGGGLGVDIGPTGLSSISYVRITNPLGATVAIEIDAVADVASIPEPGGCGMFLLAALILLGKSARPGNVKTAT
jgi:hypothetical protein